MGVAPRRLLKGDFPDLYRQVRQMTTAITIIAADPSVVVRMMIKFLSLIGILSSGLIFGEEEWPMAPIGLFVVFVGALSEVGFEKEDAVEVEGEESNEMVPTGEVSTANCADEAILLRSAGSSGFVAAFSAPNSLCPVLSRSFGVAEIPPGRATTSSGTLKTNTAHAYPAPLISRLNKS